jgi:hypothetical protein
MPNDNADRADRSRLADDGCPHISGDTKPYDLPELWSPFDEELGDAAFALSFDSGGEG